MQLLQPDDIDFSAYLEATETNHKVRQAGIWLDEIIDDAVNPVNTPVISMPWTKTVGSFQFRPGEVTVYAGQNGGGKSLITGQVALGLIKQGHKVCIASFEMKPKRTIMRMIRQFCGENPDSPRYTARAVYMTNVVNRFRAFSNEKLWLYDQQGTVNSKQVISVARYSALELGVSHIFIDSLMKCVPAEDDYNAQKYFVDELTALARDHNVHIHLIHHIRKQSNDEAMPGKNDLKGSGAIADQVDNVLLMWRNKKKEHQIQNGQPVDNLTCDAMLMCEKQRNGEAEDWYSLWYHKDSQQFLESHDSIPMAFDDSGKY